MMIRYHGLGIIIHFKWLRLGSFPYNVVYMRFVATMYIASVWLTLSLFPGSPAHVLPTVQVLCFVWISWSIINFWSCHASAFSQKMTLSYVYALTRFDATMSNDVTSPVGVRSKSDSCFDWVFTQEPQKTRFMGPTWGPHGSCRPQMGPMLAQWTLLPGAPACDSILTQSDYQTHPHTVWNDDRAVFL